MRLRRSVGPNAFGNAPGDSIAAANGQSSSARPFGETDVEAWGRVPAGAGYGFQGSGIGITNWQNNVVADASSSSVGPELTDADLMLISTQK